MRAVLGSKTDLSKLVGEHEHGPRMVKVICSLPSFQATRDDA
jgi:hypothetical protein